MNSCFKGYFIYPFIFIQQSDLKAIHITHFLSEKRKQHKKFKITNLVVLY